MFALLYRNILSMHISRDIQIFVLKWDTVYLYFNVEDGPKNCNWCLLAVKRLSVGWSNWTILFYILGGGGGGKCEVGPHRTFFLEYLLNRGWSIKGLGDYVDLMPQNNFIFCFLSPFSILDLILYHCSSNIFVKLRFVIFINILETFCSQRARSWGYRFGGQFTHILVLRSETF